MVRGSCDIYIPKYQGVGQLSCVRLGEMQYNQGVYIMRTTIVYPSRGLCMRTYESQLSESVDFKGQET